MLKTALTRRHFGFTSFAALLLPNARLAMGQSGTDRDGEAWAANAKAVKYAYVAGFLDAAVWAWENVDGALSVLKSLSPKDRKLFESGKTVWDYQNIHISQLVDGLDTFYSDYRNRAIRWDRALSYARDTIHGESKEYLDRELEFERKLALAR